MLHVISFQAVSEATLMYLIVHGIVKGLHWVMQRGERSAAILVHYQKRALGHGHPDENVEDCRQDLCTVFGRA